MSCTRMQQQLPKNFPFYDWVPKPLGIIFLVALFIPIMTVSGAYSANSSEKPATHMSFWRRTHTRV